MSISASDIGIVLSGGSSNTSPALSLGGSPSNTPVAAGKNNLFANTSQAETTAGKTDYRCVYVFNNSGSDYLYGTNFYIYTQVVGGGDIEIGCSFRQEIQRISISGPISGGSFTIKYINALDDETSVVVNYNADGLVWRDNLQAALRTIVGLEEITVDVSESPDFIMFGISFGGSADHRYHDILELVSNNLGGSPNISINKGQNGSPINAIDPEIESELSPPSNVNFVNYSINGDSINLLNVGTLGPGDGIPVWIKRTVLAGANATANDGFTLRISGNPVSV